LLHTSDTLTMAKALFELLAEETRLKSMSSSVGEGPHSVLAAVQKPRRPSFQPCEHCKQTTHRSKKCFAKFGTSP
jgi:cytidine deaminase